jgi:1-acyl-sn-glycerol-3-phosphate acyltransferase
MPFARQSHVRQSLALCQALLENPGNILILFPEGTRSVTGQLNRFKPGIGALLAGRDVPVLPCHLAGGFRAWPKGRALPRPTKLRLRIGAARNFAASVPGKESACAIAAELEQAVRELEQAHDKGTD